MTRHRFGLTGEAPDYRVSLDGVELTEIASIVGVSLDLTTADGPTAWVPQVVLQLELPDLTDIDVPGAVVTIDDGTAAGLQRLGWTPPAAEQ